MAAAVALALTATVLLVVADSARWLRLAVVAALWAALMASFAVTRSRREARVAELHLAEAERTYQLELLREIHARNDFQAKLTERTRELTESVQAGELTALRQSVDRLAAMLPALGSGDVLVERLTVSTEATRVRALGGWSTLPDDTGGTGDPAAIDAVPEAAAGLDPEPDLEAVPEPEPETQPEPEPETQPEPEVEPQPEVVAEPQVAAEPEPGAEPDVAEATAVDDAEADESISVEELLAAFGEPAAGGVGRRHRRARD